MTNNPLMAALQQFEATEANLLKLERLWHEIRAFIPSGIVFSTDNPEYEDRCRAFHEVHAALPLIDGWKPTISLPDLNGVAQNRWDAIEVDMVEVTVAVETEIAAPGREIREYRFRFNKMRRALIRDRLVSLIDEIDAELRAVRRDIGEMEPHKKISGPSWDGVVKHVAQIDVLLGSATRPPRWRELHRHLAFSQVQDVIDIEKLDWPQVKAGLRKDLYGDNEPLPVAVKDLGTLVSIKPRGDVVTQLAWSGLDEESFERLIFNLISTTAGYENPEWLTRTNAPDRGRDLAVMRVSVDHLAGTRRQRVIIQCRHWLSKSISLPDVAVIKEQMSLWGVPRIEVVTIATTGRFTTDAVQWIETHNASGSSPSLEMWPESHLELLLASRPALVAEFRLR
jgi:hypothetical protein